MKDYVEKMLEIHDVDVSNRVVHDKWHHFITEYFIDWDDGELFLETPIPHIEITYIRLFGNTSPPIWPEEDSFGTDILSAGLLPIGEGADLCVIEVESRKNKLEIGFICYDLVEEEDFDRDIRACFRSTGYSFERFFLDDCHSSSRPYSYYTCGD